MKYAGKTVAMPRASSLSSFATSARQSTASAIMSSKVVVISQARNSMAIALAMGQSLLLESGFENLAIPYGTHVPESLFSSGGGSLSPLEVHLSGVEE